MVKRNTNFTLSTKALDDLFSTQEERDCSGQAFL